MDQESLIIDLLSAGEPIYRRVRKNRQKNLISAFLFLIGASVLFFGIGSFVYQYLGMRVHSIDRGYWLRGFYHFSLVLGGISAAATVVFFLVNVIQEIRLRQSFQRFLERYVKEAAKYPVVYQDREAYYLAEGDRKPTLRLAKADCIELTTTFDDAVIYLGNRQELWGFSSIQLFVLNGKPSLLPATFPKAKGVNQKWLLLIISFIFVSGAGVFTYYGVTRYQNLYSAEPSRSTASSAAAPLTSNELLTQQGTAPTKKVNQMNQLDLNEQTRELYLTTNGGTDWSFVPLKPEWLRTGSYLLTSGEIPLGYWMDKTYDVSKAFSWFIYSENEKELFFLFSSDNGQTWKKALVSEAAQRIRYRKAQFFADGSGILVYSNISPEVSSEGLEIYQTNDQGQTWSRSNGTTINQPVQNVSFVNPALGFVSTREKLYYTNNSGSSFKEAVVTIPADYQTGGLDLFQSPNEVTQVSTHQLETKFYLLKTNGIDQGKMFACLYRSSDNGETWQFAEQLSQVQLTD
ncbi:WD40/YVTN/BNR-like repeat-containing protein [Enterococcus sp. AZ196]|uniref:WD40/YVTN/BNR-like repeat-containing protein n=1 Tax=Enterococcus sp. AZ196 TaxID=2774659 RepID=UPI003D28BA2C